MAKKLQWRAAMAVACMALGLVWSSARADEVPLITGKHWTKSSEQLKRVYLISIANVIQIESAYHAANPPSDGQSIVPRFAKGLKGETLDSVRDALDRWSPPIPTSCSDRSSKPSGSKWSCQDFRNPSRGERA